MPFAGFRDTRACKAFTGEPRLLSHLHRPGYTPTRSAPKRGSSISSGSRSGSCRVSRHKPKGFLDKLATFLENLRRYRCQMSLVGGMYIFKFEPTNTSVASYAGLMLGSESRPPREKICSTLPSCGKWLAVCLNTR